MRRFILAIILFLLASFPVMGQEPIYLPLILKANIVAPQPILRVRTNDGKIIDLLEDWEISDPYWRPQIAQYKGDGDYVDSAIADGRRLVSKKYANVVETIPLTVRGTNQAQAINRIRELLQVIRQAANYWTEPYEYDYAWLEVRPACNDCRTGYAKIVKANVPELNDPYGQPFFSAYNEAVMEDISLIVERQPLWRGVQPGTIIGPLYNLVKNPDFELWNFGVTDSQPDSWSDLETSGITGMNSREDDSHSGDHSLEVRVSQSTATNRIKGVSQVIADTKANTTYTAIAWARNDGISRGVGRILITYLSQLELYRSSTRHGWQLYTGTFTTGDNDTVAINLEILTTAANTDGTVYFDSIMILEGDWQQEAIEGMLPYMTSSHIVNHWDQAENAVVEAGDINYVDMWNIPGDENALVRLEIQNNTDLSTPSSPLELFATVRIGMRRTKDVQNFQNYRDIPGITDTTASSDDTLQVSALGTGWITAGVKNIIGENNVLDNQGRFRVLARVKDFNSISTLQSRLNYYIGTAGIGQKTLDTVSLSVGNQWTIVDLTPNAAMIWDQKFSAIIPNQVGYSIELSRTVGSSEARLDYVLALPTDGGYIKANINPPLIKSSALVVDNTAPGLTVAAVQKEEEWQLLYSFSSATADVTVIGTDGIYLYIGEQPNATVARIYKLLPGQPAQIFTLGNVSSVRGMEMYNGKFYYTHNERVFESDGSTFPGAIRINMDPTGTETIVAFSLKSFNGKLYASADRIGAPRQTRIWTWDGSSSAQIQNFSPTSPPGGGNFEIYANHLWFAMGDGDVQEYNPNTNTWTLHNVTAGSGADYLAVFQNKLYLATTTSLTDSAIYYYDGNSWKATNFTIPLVGTFLTLLTFDNRLYAQDGIDTYVSTDGLNFPRLTTFTPKLQCIFNGTLVGFEDNNVYILTPQNAQYKVGDFQGKPFLAPSRTRVDERRHRYVFSYDRQSFINNIDDKTLIGIGIVPQYLSLIGNEAN